MTKKENQSKIKRDLIQKGKNKLLIALIFEGILFWVYIFIVFLGDDFKKMLSWITGNGGGDQGTGWFLIMGGGLLLIIGLFALGFSIIEHIIILIFKIMFIFAIKKIKNTELITFVAVLNCALLVLHCLIFYSWLFSNTPVMVSMVMFFLVFVIDICQYYTINKLPTEKSTD